MLRGRLMSPDDATLLDIARASRLALAFTAAIDVEAFLADPMRQSAVQHQLVIIGEAVKRLSPEFRAEHAGVAWPEIAGMRDVLIHAYHRVDLRQVWEMVRADVPALLAFVEPFLPPETE